LGAGKLGTVVEALGLIASRSPLLLHCFARTYTEHYPFRSHPTKCADVLLLSR
jgi:hypothetical protein